MSNKDRYDDDDGRVIADMSDLDRQPLLVPQFDRLSKSRSKSRPDFQGPQEDSPKPDYYQDTPTVTREERNAMIKGGLAAGLLIGGCIALAFGILIFLLTRIG